MHIRKYIWGICYGLILTVFTGYVLLDTFVIKQVYSVVPSEYSQAGTGTDMQKESTSMQEDTDISMSNDESGAPVSTGRSYKDNNISITVTEYREYNSAIYVADILVSSAEYLKTAFAEGVYGKNITEKTSVIANKNNAILAINGDYYGTRERGYVLRNGIVYRNTSSGNQEDLVIYNDGSFGIITEDEVSADELSANGAQQILSFGPALVTDSNISVTEDEEVGRAMASNPRTAIGIIDKLHYIFVVSDGRTRESKGLSLYELAGFMQSAGVTTAYNLDGGGSSAMYFNGEVINKPTTGGRHIKERSVSDIVYIG